MGFMVGGGFALKEAEPPLHAMAPVAVHRYIQKGFSAKPV